MEQGTTHRGWGRWVSCDPSGLVDGLNLYQYGRNNPASMNDPTGLQAQHPQKKYVGAGDRSEFTGKETPQELHRRAQAAGWDFEGKPVWQGNHWFVGASHLIPKSGQGGGGKGSGPVHKAAPKANIPHQQSGGAGQPAQGAGQPSPAESFARGALKGAALGFGAGLAIGLMVASGGTLALVGIGLSVAGAFAGGVTVGELLTGEDLSGKKLTSSQKAEMWGKTKMSSHTANAQVALLAEVLAARSAELPLEV